MLRGIIDKLRGRARGRNEWKNGYRESQSETKIKILIYLNVDLIAVIEWLFYRYSTYLYILIIYVVQY